MSPEARKPIEPTELFKYLAIRKIVAEKIGPLQPETVRQLRAASYENMPLNSLRNDPEGIAKTLKGVKEAAERKPSRVTVFAGFLMNLALFQMDQYAQTLRKPTTNPQGAYDFAICFDFYDGTVIVADNLLIAEDHILGTDWSKNFDNLTNAAANQGLHRGPLQDAKEYLKVLNIAPENADLLKKDPSGLLLIKAIVSHLENGSPRISVIPESNRDIVTDGARFAKNAYGIIYPLTAKI